MKRIYRELGARWRIARTPVLLGFRESAPGAGPQIKRAIRERGTTVALVTPCPFDGSAQREGSN